MDIDGNKIDFSKMPKGMKIPKLKNCKRVAARSSQMIYTVTIEPFIPRPEGHGFSG